QSLRNGWQCTYPGPHPPQPGEAIKGTTLVEKLCDACGRDTGKSRTRGALHILTTHKAKDVESCPVPAPHFRYTKLGKDREFWQRRMAQVYLNDQVRWRIFGQIQLSFSCDQGYRLDVKTPIRLKPTLQVFTLKGRGAEAPRIDSHLFSDSIDEERNRIFEFFVCSGRAHDLQLPSIIGEAWDT